MEEKILINGLEQGIELTKRLMSNFKHTSSAESNKPLISEILRIYQNAIFMLSFNDDDKNIVKRSHDTDEKDYKKRKISDKKTEKVFVFVGTGQEKDSVDDGYSWRKYGAKEISGSINPRGYYRCTHQFTQNCLALKHIQKSDTDPSIFEVTYAGDHTCNNNSASQATTNFHVSMFEEGNRAGDVTEQREDIKPIKTEPVVVSLEDLENQRENVVRRLSFSNSNHENVGEWESNVFLGNVMKNLMESLSPATMSWSEITSEIANAPASVENSETAYSYFSSLDNIIDLGHEDWWWSARDILNW
ncbi:putative WRKY transcription factor 46 [Raphanus sativus]|nr:putative WRKY transcription factor 46 [Raphanus sativus]